MASGTQPIAGWTLNCLSAVLTAVHIKSLKETYTAGAPTTIITKPTSKGPSFSKLYSYFRPGQEIELNLSGRIRVAPSGTQFKQVSVVCPPSKQLGGRRICVVPDVVHDCCASAWMVHKKMIFMVSGLPTDPQYLNNLNPQRVQKLQLEKFQLDNIIN